MEYVAAAQRIHRMHREGRRLLQVAAFVEPERALRAARSREKRWRQLCDLLARLPVGRGGGGERGPAVWGCAGGRRRRRRRRRWTAAPRWRTPGATTR